MMQKMFVIRQRKISADSDRYAYGIIRWRFSVIYFDIWNILPLGGWYSDPDVSHLSFVGTATASGDNKSGAGLLFTGDFRAAHLLSVLYSNHCGVAPAGINHLAPKACTSSGKEDQMEDDGNCPGGWIDRRAFCKTALSNTIRNL